MIEFDSHQKQAEQPTDNDLKDINDVYEFFGINQLVNEPARVNVNTSIIYHKAITCARNIICIYEFLIQKNTALVLGPL